LFTSMSLILTEPVVFGIKDAISLLKKKIKHCLQKILDT
jgi:hypothetical protein